MGSRANNLKGEEKQLLILLGQRIRQARKSKGITQQHIAALCNAEKANLSRIETGKTNVTILTLKNIADALQIPLMVLFSSEN